MESFPSEQKILATQSINLVLYIRLWLQYKLQLSMLRLKMYHSIFPSTKENQDKLTALFHQQTSYSQVSQLIFLEDEINEIQKYLSIKFGTHSTSTSEVIENGMTQIEILDMVETIQNMSTSEIQTSLDHLLLSVDLQIATKLKPRLIKYPQLLKTTLMKFAPELDDSKRATIFCTYVLTFIQNKAKSSAGIHLNFFYKSLVLQRIKHSVDITTKEIPHQEILDLISTIESVNKKKQEIEILKRALRKRVGGSGK